MQLLFNPGVTLDQELPLVYHSFQKSCVSVCFIWFCYILECFLQVLGYSTLTLEIPSDWSWTECVLCRQNCCLILARHLPAHWQRFVCQLAPTVNMLLLNMLLLPILVMQVSVKNS